MCIICEGRSYEEAWRGVDLSIRIYGWHLQLVEGPLPWCYTIGLMETFGHPELVAVDLKMEAEKRLMTSAVGLIEREGCLEPEMLAEEQVEVVTVHDRHLESGDWFGMWSGHYGLTPPSGSFMQIIPPPDCFCDRHKLQSRRLDRADAKPLANRATRRRAARKRPH